MVSPQHNELIKGAHTVAIQPKVMSVLMYLAENAERVIGNEELLDQVWQGRIVTNSSIQKSINALRSAFSELDPDKEYVAHFSKQGYQLVAEVTVESPSVSYWGWKALAAGVSALVFVLIVLTTGVFWRTSSQPTLVKTGQQARSSALLPAYTNVVPYQQDFDSNTSIAEPHVQSGRVAYVTSKEGVITSSHLVIRNDPSEWRVSVARGEFIDLAWSPSGRNLVAVDAHSDMGAAQTASFYQQAQNYYTFNIFTLDYKGEKVVEKSVLSHWLGVVKSVTWWDENTLEFVASQGSVPQFERYHYFIPDQKLTRLTKFSYGEVPLVSRINGEKTALLVQKKSDQRISISDRAHQIVSDLIVSDALDISWLPSGDGVVVLHKSNASSVVLLNGEKQTLELPDDLSGKVFRLRPLDTELAMLASVKRSNDTLQWRRHDEAINLKNELNVDIVGARFAAGGDAVAIVVSKQSQFYLQHSMRDPEKRVEELLPLGEVSEITWNSDSGAILYSSRSSIWAVTGFSGEPALIADDKPGVIPLSLDANRSGLWGIRIDSGARNIWRFGLGRSKNQQYTYGDVGAAYVWDGVIYFQYSSQAGLWSLKMSDGEIRQLSYDVPKNIQLLSVRTEGVFFVEGGICRESDVKKLDLSSGKTTTAWERKSSRFHTYDFDPVHGILQRECKPDVVSIVKLVP